MEGIVPPPRGSVAVSVWRELPKETRRRLLDGEPAGDPQTTMIAVGYARAMLSRTALHLRLALLAIFIVTLVPIEWGLIAAHWSGTVMVLWGVAAFCAFIPVARWHRRRAIRLMRMERANSGPLWTAPLSPPVVPVPAGPLVIRTRPKALVRLYTAILLITCIGPVLLLTAGTSPPVIALTIADLALLARVGYVAARARPWLPVMVLDHNGVHLPAQGVCTPWPEITEIRITPIHGRRPSPRQVVAFMTPDPQRAMSAWRGPQIRRGRLSIRIHGTPLSIADSLLTHTAEEIAAYATAFTPAPLRRFAL